MRAGPAGKPGKPGKLESWKAQKAQQQFQQQIFVLLSATQQKLLKKKIWMKKMLR